MIRDTAKIRTYAVKGCILLGLFWLFQFRFKNNRIHGISISKRTLIYSENEILMAEVTWELLRVPTGRQASGAGGCVGFPAKKVPKRTRILPIPSKPYSVQPVHSAIGSRMNGISFRKRNSSQKSTNTLYSEYFYSGIVPKERALSVQCFFGCSL